MSKQQFILSFTLVVSFFLSSVIAIQYYLHEKANRPFDTFDFQRFQQLLPNKEMKALLTSDKVLVINAWATWCAPCIQEIPQLNKLRYKKERNLFDDRTENIEFIAVSSEPDSIVYTAMKEETIPNFFWRTLNGNNELNGFIVRYGKEKGSFGTNQGIPVTIVIKGNKLFYSQIGFKKNTVSVLDSAIKVALLAPVK